MPSTNKKNIIYTGQSPIRNHNPKNEENIQ